MSWFAIALLSCVVVYIMIDSKKRSKEDNKKFEALRRGMKFNLDLLNKMVGDGESEHNYEDIATVKNCVLPQFMDIMNQGGEKK